MAIITGTALESNRKFRVNFDGGNLSSDGGLLLLKEFYHKLGVNSLFRKSFHTTDSASFRIHKDYQNLLQMLYQITGAYFQDDHADSLRNDPVLNAVIGKTALASQPTLSRFHNRMDEQSLQLLEEIQRILRRRVYSVEKPEHVLFDLDSTLLAAYGAQEGEAFNYHYQAHGYHPLLCFDGLTGDLLKVEMRPGTQYCSKGAAAFMLPLLEEYQRESNKTPDEEEKRMYVSTIFTVEYILGLLSAILIVAIQNPIIQYFNNEQLRGVIYIVAFLPLLQNLIPMLQVLFVSVGRAKLIAVRNLIISLARLVAVIIACYVTKDIILIFYVLLVLDIGQIIFFMVSFARLKYSIRIKHTCFKYMKPILAFSIPMAVYLLTNSLSRDLDKYVIHHPGSKRKTLNHDEMFDCGACH